MEKLYSVSEINRYVKNIIESEDELQNVQVVGEVSNFKRQQPSGHCYFSLKDKGSVLKCVMFRGRAMSLRFEPKNGDTVIAVGHVSVYDVGGYYQLYADLLIPKGQGDLMLEYEKLRQKLSSEGLFDSAAKPPLPDNPRTVGIVTSPTGAAVRDIITVARRRNPGIKLYLYPVKVQGKGAAEEIVKAIRFFNRTGLAEVLIVGRGGGSMEDLWAFNEEKTVRAVAASKIPVISAVGHETDFTLCDFAASGRAATPSQAAEMAVADVDKYHQQVLYLEKRLQTLLLKELERYEYRLERCTRSWALDEPRRLFQKQEERLQRLLDSRILREPRKLYADKELRLTQLLQKAVLQEPHRIFEGREQRLDIAMADMREVIQKKLADGGHSLELIAARLAGLNPLAALARGYSVAQINKRVLNSVEQVAWGDEIETELADGKVYSVVQSVERIQDGN